MTTQTNQLLDLMKIGYSDILKENLVGIYLHGSYAFETYNESISDLDFLIVVNNKLSFHDKKKLLDYTVDVLYPLAPKKGLEFHVLELKRTRESLLPMAFDLHFSDMHYSSYIKNKDNFIQTMNGVDDDLTAHLMITRLYGKVLTGPPIQTVFSNINEDEFLQSILLDINDAETDILTEEMYITLNLCRVLAFKRNKLVLSKKGGGDWGLANLPPKYHSFIKLALDEYASTEKQLKFNYPTEDLRNFAKYMLTAINS